MKKYHKILFDDDLKLVKKKFTIRRKLADLDGIVFKLIDTELPKKE
jgi:hypothetical protein